jgi:hypothetical protein
MLSPLIWDHVEAASGAGFIAVQGLRNEAMLERQCTNNSFDSGTRPVASGHGKAFVLLIIGFEHRCEATTRDIQECGQRALTTK